MLLLLPSTAVPATTPWLMGQPVRPLKRACVQISPRQSRNNLADQTPKPRQAHQVQSLSSTWFCLLNRLPRTAVTPGMTQHKNTPDKEASIKCTRLPSLPKVGFLESTDDAFISFTDKGFNSSLMQVLPTYQRLPLTRKLLCALTRLRGVIPLLSTYEYPKCSTETGEKPSRGPLPYHLAIPREGKMCIFGNDSRWQYGPSGWSTRRCDAGL